MSLLILIGRGLDLRGYYEEMTDTQIEVNFSLCSFQGVSLKEVDNLIENSGGNGERVPPVPIPNTEVKPLSADGTWLETARESRTPPDPFYKEES